MSLDSLPAVPCNAPALLPGSLHSVVMVLGVFCLVPLYALQMSVVVAASQLGALHLLYIPTRHCLQLASCHAAKAMAELNACMWRRVSWPEP